MNYPGNQLITLFVTIILFGCNAINHKSDSVGSQAKQAILLDSLDILDSLVLKKRVKHADESIKYAKQAGRVAHELNTPTARVKAYISAGNAYSATSLDSGRYFYNKAMTVIDSFNLTEARGKVLYNLGMLSRSTGNYKNHILLIDSAFRYSLSVNDFITMSNSLNTLGNFHYTIGEKVHARKMFDSAYAVANKKMLFLQMGSALGNLARFEKDNDKALNQQRLAISYMKRCSGSEEPIALALINIGNRCTDVDSAIFYYDQAISMVSAELAPVVVIGAYNNMAYCYLGKGDVKNAEKCLLDHAFPLALKTNNVDWQSTVYDTYADVLQRKGSTTEAMVYKNKSTEARKNFSASVSTIILDLKKY